MLNQLMFESSPNARFAFSGPMGERIKANLGNWLLCAPVANPGMTEMFRLRDRDPRPDLVPWAGEFVGKYLISAIQARRMVSSNELNSLIQCTIAELIKCQADDGYLGPFTKDQRLLGHWDLWGHYHWMLALMMWHEDTADTEALDCVIRAADLVCRTYLDTHRKLLDAGSHEMNMAIIHVLGRVYRKTGVERYLQMMRQIEKEWQQAGDYFRAGLARTDFFQTPKPRWESLHDLQGLVELYQITGDDRYKASFENLWWSILYYDRHNTGGFSTGEQAAGDPYKPGAIETCCTTAWMAITVDMLRMTGNPIAADELELSTWNSMLASQHPSGRWWTYDTPMDGVRAASAHSIVFQARHGTPELNCCSVNGPRGLGMLSEWAIMADDEGIIVNYYGPVEADLHLSDGTGVKLIQETEYPVSGLINFTISPSQKADFSLRLRIPHWSKETTVAVNGSPIRSVCAGNYLSIQRAWRQDDRVELHLDMSLRCEPGERDKEGCVSIYRGPLLLAYDQHFNAVDPDEVPALDITELDETLAESDGLFKPVILLKVKAGDGNSIYLCDFATAGAYGNHYRSWLPAVNLGPSPFHVKSPRNGECVTQVPLKFQWTDLRGDCRRKGESQIFLVARDNDLRSVVIEESDVEESQMVVHEPLESGGYFWKVVRKSASGSRTNEFGPRRFVFNPQLP